MRFVFEHFGQSQDFKDEIPVIVLVRKSLGSSNNLTWLIGISVSELRHKAKKLTCIRAVNDVTECRAYLYQPFTGGPINLRI